MNQIAAIQMASGTNVGANLLEAERLIGKAVKNGAKMVVLPENFALMGMKDSDMLSIREEDGNGSIQEWMGEQAKRHDIWICGGTIPLKSIDPDKVSAASLIYDNKGKRQARYNKIHLFDVQLVETGERYVESETITPGDELVVIDSPLGKLGMAICYDLRFPELFRALVAKGAEIILLPSAFTAVTGKAHWQTLVRARAIENLAYVVAPAQGGYHVNGRETYGHSMIVDHWGRIIDELASGSGYVSAELDLDALNEVRRNFPVLTHRKL